MRTEPSVLTQLRGYRQALCPDSRCPEKQLVTATLRKSHLPKEVSLRQHQAAWQQAGGEPCPMRTVLPAPEDKASTGQSAQHWGIAANRNVTITVHQPPLVKPGLNEM